MPTPEEWFSSIPPISKAWGVLILGLAATTYLRLLEPKSLALILPLVFGKFQVWRLLTCFFWGSGLPLLFNVIMIAQCAVKLEQDAFLGRPADFLFFLFFGMAALLLLALLPFFSVFFLTNSLITMAVYLWSRRYPNSPVSVYGLFSMPAFYFPFFLIAISLVLGNSILPDVMGCLVGHLYYFLDSVYPEMSGQTLLVTPGWVHWLIAKWEQSAPGTFQDSGARPTSGTQPIQPQTREGAAGAGTPSAGPRVPSAVPAGGSSNLAPASTQAFRGRAYRLDRD